jgi:hypothetical protein
MDKLTLLDKLAPLDKVKLEELEPEDIHQLLHLYYLDTPADIDILRIRISKRLLRGVNRTYLQHLKLLYVYLGHYLKKSGVIR